MRLTPLLLAVTVACAAPKQAPLAAAPGVDHVGLFTVRTTTDDGHVLLTLPPPDADGVATRLLYTTALRTGLGSAPIGLDRNMCGPTRLLVFRRIGTKVAAQYENTHFRADSGSTAERAAARDSFVTSFAWMGDIKSTKADGSIVVDITGFLTTDTTDITGELEDEGVFKVSRVDGSSAADPRTLKVFPDNIEIDAVLTFKLDSAAKDRGSEMWKEVANIAPDPRLVTFTVHHSFVRLPDAGYRVRRVDPHVGGMSNQVVDFAVPLGGNIVYDLANRFRLEKVDAAASRSAVKKPIVFYIDRGAPEPVRSALADGVRWWADAFDAAGFVDAFRVEILPDDVDPLDVRYNVVNWTDRATRGWSFGQRVIDPRTGEIIKGSVILGSLRVRQDVLIFEGLAGADKVGTGDANDPVQIAMQRMRQLAAHEVGHSIGLTHNFAASSLDRASVMDYPAPRITVKGDTLDLSDAYGRGIGAWDRFAIDWLYGDPASGDIEAAARAKVKSAIAAGMRFISDIDARNGNTAQRWASMWDDGANPTAELTRMLEVRRVALARFGLGALGANEPVADLRRKLVPIWLLHRYQVDATAKAVGGIDFTYATNGDGHEAAQPVPPAEQRAALAALLSTLDPAVLRVPERLVPYLSAGRSGPTDRQYAIEIFDTATSSIFDPLVAADAAAEVTLKVLLAPERLARVVVQHASDAQALGLDELLTHLVDATVESRPGELGRRIAYRVIVDLAALTQNAATTPEVAATVADRLRTIADKLHRSHRDAADIAWSQSLSRILDDHELLEAMVAKLPRPARAPQGMPIGAAEDAWMEQPAW